MQKNIIEKLNEITSSDLGIIKRKILGNNQDIYIGYIKQITNIDLLTNCIITPIVSYCNQNKGLLNAQITAESIIYIPEYLIDDNLEHIINYILKGYAIISFSTDNKYIICTINSFERRGISDPELTYSLRGPKDSFTENLDVNLSLLRYRIKDPNLKIKILEIGERTKARVAVIYIQGIAGDNCVNDIINRINNIHVDGIFESGYIQKFLLNHRYDLFPQIGIIERSDMGCSSILQGKILIITEGSGLALSAPKTFPEFFESSDDLYDNVYISIFSKLLRLLAILSTLTISSIYVSLVSFQPDILPTEYIMSLAQSRAPVPFNAFIEAFLMETISEVLREAVIRLPKQIGSTIGIAGTIVIGQAAVAAGLFSPLMIIISSFSLLSSFVAPDYTIVTPIRILKFAMLCLAGMFGLLGFVMGLTIITINLVSNNSFGTPYLTPFAPLNIKSIKNYFLSVKSFSKKKS